MHPKTTANVLRVFTVGFTFAGLLAGYQSMTSRNPTKTALKGLLAVVCLVAAVQCGFAVKDYR